MPFHRCCTQQQINLIIVIPVSPQILNDTKTTLTIGYSCIEEVLFAILIDGEALEIEHPPRPELRLNRTRYEYGRFPIHHTELFLSIFHDCEFGSDHAGHFDCTAE